jgi:hypothetical protein
MLPAWRSALSTGGFGEDGGNAYSRGAVTCFACGGLASLRFESARMTCGTQPPCCGVGTLEHVGGDFARDAWGASEEICL